MALSPSVTVILAAKDTADYLGATLASLRAQTFARFDLVAVNDGSVDTTGDLFERYKDETTPDRPVTVHHTNGLGLSAARNLALADARGDFILVLDGDDLLDPTLIEKLAGEMHARPELDFLFPQFDHIGFDDLPLGVRSAVPAGTLTPSRLLVDRPVHTDSGTMVRRSAVDAAGPFDEALTGCVGLDLWYRVAQLRPGNVECYPEALVRYRRRAGQLTSRADRMEQNFRAVLKKYADDPALPASVRRRAMATHHLYCASLTYAAGEYGAARRYTAEAWKEAPGFMAQKPYAWMRGGVSVVSLLPRPLHESAKRFGLGLMAAKRP